MSQERTYNVEQTKALLTLAKLMDIEIYDQTTLGDLEILIKHKLLQEYGTQRYS